jgi:Ser/Thr protein kinase RdoA (MazF antagonist)
LTQKEKEINKHSFFIDALSAFYNLSPSRLESLNSSCLEDGRMVYGMYRVEQHNGPTQILFAYHDDAATRPLFRWETDQSRPVWLLHRATLLTFLAEQHYPAPRVLPSRTGALVVRSQPWHFLVTTYIEGEANVLTPENMVLLGSALGQLHRLPLPDKRQIGPSWWNETYSLPHALEHVTAATAAVPVAWKGLCERIQHTLDLVNQQLAALPHVILHGDCWAPNAITQERQVVLIDWEGAGQGAALLDLGTLLLRCQYDRYGDIPHTLQAQHLVSVISGYVRSRFPSPEELEMLGEALRFSIAWGGAWIISRTLTDGWNPRTERLLTRIQRGYDLAEPIARAARHAFEQAKTPLHRRRE